MKFRIKQTDENKFIPQVKMAVLMDWESIESYGNGNIKTFPKKDEDRYFYKTYEDAEDVIIRLKFAINKSKSKFPKYHNL